MDSFEIKTIFFAVIGIVVGTVYVLSGWFGWRYPILKIEYRDKHSHEKIGYQAARIIVGAALAIVCVWMIIDTIVSSMNN